MGCNSHLAIEVKGLDTASFWDCWATDIFEIPWYAMYAAMADVRNGFETPIDPVSQPKGLPEDASLEATNYIWGIGGHSETWLTVAEYQEALRRAIEQQGPNEGQEWKALGGVLSTLTDYYGQANVRLIVGFDN